MSIDTKGRVIAFAGPAGSGKDEALAALRLNGQSPFGGGWVNCKFAEPLKKAAAAMLGVEEHMIEKMKDKGIPEVRDGQHTVRELLKVWGCSVRDSITPYFWADIWEYETLDLLKAQPHLVAVATDIRFPQEVEAVHALGGVVIHIDRVSNTDGSQFAPDRTHASEQGLPAHLIDHRITNPGINANDFHKRVINTVIPLIHSIGIK